MMFFDPKDPAASVKGLINKVNRGEMISQEELFTLRSFYIYYKQVRDLINPIGRKIINRDANKLPA